MRRSDLAAALALAYGIAGCSIPLEDTAAPPPGPAPVPAPVQPGCRLFHRDVGGPRALSGAGRSLEAAGGAYLWLFDGADTPNGEVNAPGALVAPGPPADCFASASFEGGDPPSSWLDVTAHGVGPIAFPLDGARTAAGTFLYYEAYEPAPGEPFGIRRVGFGVARLDTSVGRYVAGPPLWTADRPRFGTSVLAEAGDLFVHGCREIPDTFDATCFVARVPVGDVEDVTAYRYYAGTGAWVDNIEAAVPITNGTPLTSVRYIPARARYLMSGVPILGNTIQVRTGLAPEGPWSRAVDLAACDTPADDPGAFCGGGAQHPEIAAGGADGIAVSYAIVSLSAESAARRAADPLAYWPRLAIVPWPDLP